MKILIINSECLRINSSANLCHLAYIRGLVMSGHDVSVLSAEDPLYKIDPAMELPKEVKRYSYSGVSFYQRLSFLKKKLKVIKNIQSTGVTGNILSSSKTENYISRMKMKVRGCYGPYGTNYTFVKKARRFRSEKIYDVLISIAAPAASHLLAHNLLKNGHIKCKHWIQIWEDPWYADLYGYSNNDEVFQEEKKLLGYAEKICYVSPLTLVNQKRLFPEFAHKMYWRPLPFYYEGRASQYTEWKKNIYGYFGDYVPKVRNLTPFYEAARDMGITVNICGNPNNLFEETEQIHVYPRLPLDHLRPIENSTNVLIFLCNLSGGQIPGKIYQYSATKKIILFILDGSEDEQRIIRKFFEPYNRFVFCDNNKKSIVEAIKQIENHQTDYIKNEPILDFEPVRIISGILSAVEE